MKEERESLGFDIVFAGGGPANLASAIRLKQLVTLHNEQHPEEPLDPAIAIVEKGRHAGSHLLSGAVLDTKALEELIPDFRDRNCPLDTIVSRDRILFLTAKRSFAVPAIPEPFRNSGHPLVSLSRLGYWMAGEAETAGIELFTNTAAVKPIVENSSVCGLLTGDLGIDRLGKKKPDYLPGAELRAKVTVIGEGVAGTLATELQNIFSLRRGSAPQHYETGVKEVWRIPAGAIEAGEAWHTFGYPLTPDTYGGGWLYAFSPTEISVGHVTAIDPQAPESDPHGNLQLFKQHPAVAAVLKGGTLLEYGAKTITSGGLDAMGRISGPGFLFTGESAGMLNMQRLKGIHLAMKSGMLAADTIFEALLRDDFSDSMLQRYEKRFRNSWAYDELHASRHFRQAFDKGLYHGLLKTGLHLKFPGLSLASPFPFKKNEGARPAHPETTGQEHVHPAVHADGQLSFSKEECLFRSGTMHEENQPCHLRIAPADITEICIRKCTEEYGNPCTRFCPANVYAFTRTPEPALRISSSNCLHCKTCALADPYGIISWIPPEGGGGPGYKLG